MSDFKPGEIVDITIKGVRVSKQAPIRDDGRDHSVLILDEHSHLYALPPQAAITRVAPAEWPPQINDLWRDSRGTLWFARADGYGNPMLLNGSNRPQRSCDGVNKAHGPLILVHREQLQVTPAPDDPVISQDCWQQQHTSCVGCDCACHCESDGGETS